MALSVVEPMVPVLVPPVAVNTTVAPPVVMLLPAASFAVSVSVIRLPEFTEAAALTTEVAAEMAPGVTLTVVVFVAVTVLTVAPMVVAVPDVTPVNDAV